MIFRNSSHCESWAPSGGPTTQLTTAVRTVGHSGRCMLRGIQCAEGSAYMDCYPPFHKALYYPKLSRVPCLLPLYTILSIPPLFPLLFRVSPPSPLLLSCSHRRRLLHNFHTGTYQNIFKQKSMIYGCWTLLPPCNPSIWEIDFRRWFDIDPVYALILASAWGPRVVRFSRAVWFFLVRDIQKIKVFASNSNISPFWFLLPHMFPYLTTSTQGHIWKIWRKKKSDPEPLKWLKSMTNVLKVLNWVNYIKTGPTT